MTNPDPRDLADLSRALRGAAGLIGGYDLSELPDVTRAYISDGLTALTDLAHLLQAAAEQLHETRTKDAP